LTRSSLHSPEGRLAAARLRMSGGLIRRRGSRRAESRAATAAGCQDSKHCRTDTADGNGPTRLCATETGGWCWCSPGHKGRARRHDEVGPKSKGCSPIGDRKRPGSGQHGVEFGIGEADGRHGISMLNGCAPRAYALRLHCDSCQVGLPPLPMAGVFLVRRPAPGALPPPRACGWSAAPGLPATAEYARRDSETRPRARRNPPDEPAGGRAR
jgi:hypothetical protein